ncbi:MAG: hypothetical protein M1840_002018 [Geoglossum simile]|nr:MAG: hypothetical protein M1840_002018 [Geoglossum simile]
MRLDVHGKIAAADIAFYAPVFVVTGYLALKHGCGKALGWLFLVLLSIIRLAFGILVVAMEGHGKPSLGLFITASILASVGLTLLLMASLGFLRTVASTGFSDKALLPRFLDRTQMILVIAIALSIAGGTLRIPTNKPSTQKTGQKLVKAGVVIVTVTFASLIGFTVYFWAHQKRLTAARRMLLRAFTLAIPFLVVRIVYSILGAFASTSFSKWSPVRGSWRAFLVMGLIMEFVVVLVYAVTGVSLPDSKEERADGARIASP